MTYNFDQVIDRRNSDSRKWTNYPSDVIPLWVADMDFLTPEPIRNALHTMIDRGVLGYEFLQKRTQQVVADRMERLYDWRVDPDWVVAVTGVVTGFSLAARMICQPGDGVVIHTPAYNMFYSIYERLGVVQQSAPMHMIVNGNVLYPQFDLDAFANAFHSNNVKTRMFLFCHPHNPLGRTFSRKELRSMAEICLQNDVIIVSDEIHSELLLNGADHIPMATLSPEVADKTITLIASSKTFNTAGAFCAFAIIPNAELREQYQKANEQITGHVASFGLVASEAALSGVCDDWLQELRVYLRGNRDFAVDYLTENFPDARFTVPYATYLQFIDFSDYVDTGRIQGSPFDFFLEKARVALSDGKIFGRGFEKYARLNFGSPRSQLAEGLERMRGAVYGGMK